MAMLNCSYYTFHKFIIIYTTLTDYTFRYLQTVLTFYNYVIPYKNENPDRQTTIRNTKRYLYTHQSLQPNWFMSCSLCKNVIVFLNEFDADSVLGKTF